MNRKLYEDIIIGIVLYNPDINTLEKNIYNLKLITDDIIFIDNGSSNKNEIEKIIQNKYAIIFNNSNLGIAKALNQLLEEAIKKNKRYLLTLDQDSRMNRNIFDEMYKYRNIENVAIICPTIYDINKSKNKTIKMRYEYVSRCITSGSLMNISICSKLNKFDEKMFIDYVDFDYCKNIMLSGYKIIQVREALLPHEVGKRIKRRFIFWDVYPTNYNNTQRYYYFARNIKYYLLKYKGNLTIKEWIHDEIHLKWKFINVFLYENNWKEKLKMYIQGLKDARKM